MRPRISIRGSVRPSVRWSIMPSLRRLRDAEYSALFYGSVTDGPTDGRTDPLIEMRGRIKKLSTVLHLI